MTSQTLLTTAQSAQQLNMSPATIRRLIKAGALPARRIGSMIRISQEDLKSVGSPVVPVGNPLHWKTALSAIELPR